MTAVDSAHSPSKRLRMLGIRNATTNASVTPPAPKVSAITMSRAKPRTRLASVARPMEPSARTTWCSSARAGALTLQFRRGYGMLLGFQNAKESSRGQHEISDQTDTHE